MKCFYHGDGDGMCSAYLVSKIPNTDSFGSEFIEANYDMVFPLESIQPNENVYIVDFSIKPKDMLSLLERTPNVVWIDHHVSAIQRYDNFPHKIRGIRYDGIAACMLTYCFLFQMTNRGLGNPMPLFVDTMTESAPLVVKLLADYDVWTFKYGDKTRWFQLAFNAYSPSPTDTVWDEWNNSMDAVNKMIDEGRVMEVYRKSIAKTYCERKGFEVEFEGYRAFVMNIGIPGSDLFDSIKSGDYDLYIPFCYDGNQWTFSVYSTKVNCAEIAMKYGGGGHAGAAGFSTKELPF